MAESVETGQANITFDTSRMKDEPRDEDGKLSVFDDCWGGASCCMSRTVLHTRGSWPGVYTLAGVYLTMWLALLTGIPLLRMVSGSVRWTSAETDGSG